jgi:hypothetical protein
VIGQVNGRVLDDLGNPVVGASVIYNVPTATITRTITKALTSVTTAADGTFTISNLQSGGYLFQIIPSAPTTGTNVSNLAYITTITVPNTATTNSTAVVVNAGTIVLPRLGGTITGVVDQQASANATLVPINAKTLTIDLSSGGGYTSYWYPTYSATTKAITLSQYITTTTSATGAFSLTNMPMITYGGSGTGNVASSTYPINIDLGTGSEVSSSSVSLVTTFFPAVTKLGYAGTTGTATFSDPCIASTSNYPALKFLSTSTTDSTGNSGNVAVGTTASPTQIVLTFNNALSTTLPTTSCLYDASGTEVLATLTNTTTSTLVPATVAVSSTTPTQLTITPNGALVAGTQYKILYSVTDGKTALASSPLTDNSSPLYFTTAGTYPTLALVSTSTKDAYGNTNDFAVNATIVLTFNEALSTVYSTNPALTDVNGNPAYACLYNYTTSSKVSATVTMSSNTLTITPTTNLLPNNTYYVSFSVSDGKAYTAASPYYSIYTNTYIGYNTGSYYQFTTVASTTGPVAITNLAVSTSPLTGMTSTGAFNSGFAQMIPVSFTYNANYTYTEYYATTTAAGVQGAWTPYSSINPANVSGTTAYAELYCPAFTSGQSVSIKLVESSAATNNATSTSNVLTIADTVSPTSFSAGTNTGISYTTTTATVSGGYNAGTTATTLEFWFNLANNEVQTLPVVTVASTGSTATTTLAASNIAVVLNTAGTTATVTVTVPAGDNFATSTLSVVLADGAGNKYQTGTPAVNTPIVVTINP